MLSITHIVVTLLLIQLMSLDRNNAFVALLFGVFIDVDHLFGLVKYTELNGVASILDFHTLMNPGGQWKSMLHNPIAAAVVVPISAAFTLAVPLIFWGVHLLMDYAEQAFLGHFSAVEAWIIVFAGLGLVALRYRRHIMTVSPELSFGEYLRRELNGLRSLFRAKPRAEF
jgi:Ni,Fe-hydrogenase I cytochrome b subunit